jgi:hypothetical protein
MTLNQISIFLENRPGQLAEITQELTEAQINLFALNISEASEYGLIRIIVDDTEKALTVLRENGFLASGTKVISVGVSDKPGGLDPVAKVISDAKINIEYMYSFIIGHESRSAGMIFRVNDTAAAETKLAAKGIQVLSLEDIQ